jgi:hypothetical protein
MRRLLNSRERRRETAIALSNSPFGLLAPLNCALQSKRAQKLIELLRTLKEIEQVEAMLAEVERQLSQEPNYAGGSLLGAPSHVYAKANEILSACHWSPRVAPPPNQLHSFTWNARTAKSDWENRFVFWLLNLRASGEISLIRSCRNCEQWFYAITNHQTHCSDRCRQNFHSKDKIFREKRRLYMRRYRKDEKSKGLAAVQLLKKDFESRNVNTRAPRLQR